MGKYQKKRAGLVLIKVKRAMPLLLLAVGIACVCLVGGLVAKYVTSNSYGDNQIGAEDFYFTIDLLSAQEGQNENDILTRTVELRGAGQNSLNFSVQNFMDELRISGMNVDYTLSWTGDIGITKGGEALDGNKTHTYTLSGGASAEHTFTASFTDPEKQGEADITVASTAPYSKIMKLHIDFYPQNYDVLYRVEDEPNDPYARLIVMVGKANGVEKGNLRFLWDVNALEIDCTNTNVVGTDMVVPAGVNSGNTTSTQAVEESGSISVLFFKKDSTKDYSKADTVAEMVSGVYEIKIPPIN